jgi:hypothetical protein
MYGGADRSVGTTRTPVIGGGGPFLLRSGTAGGRSGTGGG